MNEQLSEQVFDSLLTEVLTGQNPPDLSARIEAAWMREKAGETSVDPRALIKAEIVESTAKAANIDPASTAQLSRALEPTVNPSAQNRPVASQPNEEPTISIRRRLIAGLLGVAAAGVLAMLSVQAVLTTESNGWPIASGSALDSEGNLGGVDTGIDPSGTVPTIAGNAPAADAAKRQGSTEDAPAGQKMNLQDLPFPTESAVASGVPIPSWSPSAVRVQPMPPETIVEELDQRLQRIWDQVGVSPTKALPEPLVAARMRSVLTGAPLKLPDIRDSSTSQTNRIGTAEMLVKTSQFASFWAQSQTRGWLKRSGLPADGVDADLLAASVERMIADGMPWGQVASELIGGQLEGTDSPTPARVFMTALSGGGNHRLAKRIGANFLNENLECIRCHDQRSEVGEPELQSQHVYWSLLALLNGIDAEGNGFRGERMLSDRQREMFADANAPTIFYELPSGELVAADAKLPGGVDWRTVAENSPRAALASWISQSEELDRAAVNQSWKLIFGRFLAPQVESLDQAADGSRSELLNFLATQFRAHGQDVRQLASWIVSSKAFAGTPLQVTQNALLQMNEEQLQQIKLADLVFASGTVVSESLQSGSLEKSIATLLESSGSDLIADGQETLLGQPSFDQTGNAERVKNGKLAKPMSALSLSYALHGEVNTLAELDFVGKLLKSERLNWEQRVDHIVALSQHGVANDRVQQLAKELLQRNQGDAQRALLELLWAVNHSDAS